VTYSQAACEGVGDGGPDSVCSMPGSRAAVGLAVAALEGQVTATGIPIKWVRVENNSPGFSLRRRGFRFAPVWLQQFGRILVL